jgi:hypothetical protein
VNDNPDFAKAWTQHKPPYPTPEQLERANNGLDELDELTSNKVTELIEASQQKNIFLVLMQKAMDFDQIVVKNKIETDFGVDIYSSQITLKVTSKNGELREIVADYLVQDGNNLRIVDSKFTQKTNFDVEQSFTPNQKDTFDWLRKDQVQSIEIRADNSKLNNFPEIHQGDNLDLDALKVDVYKSTPDVQAVGSVISIF